MTTQPEIVRQSDLLNQLVLDRQKMEELGRIDLLWAHPQSHKVFGFICKSGFLGAKRSAFKLTQLEAIGSNGVLTHGQPEPTDTEKVKQLESLINREVWSNAGNKLGKITDYVFNLKTGAITEYLFVSNGWSGITGEVYKLPPRQILSLGRRRILVAESQTFSLYQEGIRQKIAKAGDVLREDYTQATNSIRQKLPTIAEQAKGRWHNLTDLARERAQSLSQQAKETVQTFNEQLREETEGWVEQARQRSQTIADQLRERTETLSEQVEEGIQTLTVQAREILDAPEDDDASPAAPPSQHAAVEVDDFDDWFPSDPIGSGAASSNTSSRVDHDEPGLTLEPLSSANLGTSSNTVVPPSTASNSDEPWFDDSATVAPAPEVTHPVKEVSNSFDPNASDDDEFWFDTDTSTSAPVAPKEAKAAEDDDEPWI